MRKRTVPWWMPILLLGAAAPLAHAQNTITITVGTTTGFTAVEQGANSMPSVGDDAASPTTKKIDLFHGGAFEYPVSTTTPGLYAITFNGWTNWGNDQLAFETRPASISNDPYATRFTSRDTALLPNTAKVYTDFTGTQGSGLTDADGNVILVPLWSGQNVLRVWSSSTLHEPAAAGYPIADLSSTSVRTAAGSDAQNVRIDAITLTRVSDLPAMGTITGKVTGDKPAGIPVSDAFVAANPPGQSPPELSNYWKNGWWTKTKSDGTYTLSAPVGSTEVKAGRPSSYDPGGAMQTVTVSSSPVTADIQLPSIFHDDGTGHQAAFVQAEYYDAKNLPAGLYNWGGHENGLGLYGSWNANGPAWEMSYEVDAPAAGLYKAGVALQWWGNKTDKFSITTDLGATSTLSVPTSTGTPNWGQYYQDFPDLIYLSAGHNVVTLKLLAGPGGWDAIHFTQTDQPATVGNVRGTVTDRLTGNPISGATVNIGGNLLTTDATGGYKALLSVGTYPVTVTAPYMDAPITGAAAITQGQTLTQDYQITIRPHASLATSAGLSWKAAMNTGGAADFSAVTADESAFSTVTVPSSVYSSTVDQSYMWYRLHFTVPSGLLGQIPGRMVIFRVPQSGSGGSAIAEADQVFLNGTSIGQTGAFPTTPLPAQADGYRQPAAGPIDYPAGFMSSPQVDRAYYFPASLLQTGDNVLAVKVYTNAKNGYLAGASGIVGTPSLEIAPPTASVSGKVQVNGSPVPDARVAALDENAIASDWTFTDANGNFTLPHVLASGTVTVCVVKPGYGPATVSPGVLANGASVNGLTVNVSAPGGVYPPIYDDFTDTTGTGWMDKWLGQNLSNPTDPTQAPTVTEPGFDQNNGTPLDSTVTIQNPADNVHWSALISKDRISRWASLTSGRLVSLLDGTEIDVWMLGSNNPDTNTLALDNAVGFDIRPTLGGVYEASQGGQNKLLWWIRNGNATPLNAPGSGAVPGNFAADTDITPANPLEFTFARAGSVWDLYLNNTLVWSGNIPMAGMGDHRISTSTWTSPSGQTWDWFRATPLAGTTPLKGDLNGNGIVDPGDAALALRMAAGLLKAADTDVTTGNVTGSGTTVDVLDAVRILEAAAGRPLP